MYKTLNIPTELLQQYRFDKIDIEMIAVAIIVKSLHENSTLYLDNLSIQDFGKLICVSYYKAKKLLEAAKQSNFFIFNEKKNSLYAKPFKSKVIITRGKHGQYQSAEDFVRKIDIQAEHTAYVDGKEKIISVSLRKVVVILRRTLLENAIGAEERERVKSRKAVSCNPDTKPIPMRSLAKSFGMSKSSASRYIKGMVDDKEVSKSEMVTEYVIPNLNDTTTQEYLNRPYHRRFIAWCNPKTGHWSGWTNLGCRYAITNSKVKDSFQHVIYNHKKRLSSVVNNNNPLAYLDNFNA